MSLLEKHIRATIVHEYIADAFVRFGHKTEGRLLKVQSAEVISLLTKAVDEMPQVEPFEAIAAVLGGPTMKAAYYDKRRKRGKHYERIGKAEKLMLKTLRKAFDSFYRGHKDWTRRAQIAATSRMMKSLMDTPRNKAKALLEENPTK